MLRTQDADLNLMQNLIELFPTTMIGFGDIENDGFALNFPFGTRRCVFSGRL
jgi:hypothetical protein